jgi:hypothetical protein
MAIPIRTTFLIRAIGTITITTTIRKNALSATTAPHNSRIVVNAIYLVYIRFVVELAIVLGNIHLRNRNVRRTTLDTYIVIDFRRE